MLSMESQVDEPGIPFLSMNNDTHSMDLPNPMAATSSLEEDMDMLRQLIEDIESDCRANKTQQNAAQTLSIAGTDLAKNNVENLGEAPTLLSVVPQVNLVPADLYTGATLTYDDDNHSEYKPSSDIDVRPIQTQADYIDDRDDSIDMIEPYSQTSSASSSDVDDPPALPPRTWRRAPPSPDSLAAGQANIPSITVSPPSHGMGVALANAVLDETVALLRKSREEVEELQAKELTSSMAERKDSLMRFSTSCPSLENQGWFDNNPQAAGGNSRTLKAHYKSLLDVTKEEDEEEVRAANGESPKTAARHHPSGPDCVTRERPKSLDFSAVGAKLSISGVTAASSSTDFHSDHSGLAERHRKVSFNMSGGGGAQKEKSKFQKGITSAENRSFSLGNLGSEDSEDDYLAARVQDREQSVDSDGHVKPIDTLTYGAPLQKLPNVDFSKHVDEQSFPPSHALGDMIYKNQSQARHGLIGRTVTTPQGPTSNLSKNKSISSPAINLVGGDNHPSLGKGNDPKKTASSRPLSEESSLSPSHFEAEEDKRRDKKAAGRRTSVFAKFGSIRKANKNKEKESKLGANHYLVSVVLTTSETCNHCGKLVREAVQCSYCLSNYHEECKDKVLPCPKQKAREKKPSSLLLRPTSFREKSPGYSSLGLPSPSGHKMPFGQNSLSSLPRNANDNISDSGSVAPGIGEAVSMESLIDDGNADDEDEEEPELKGLEPESWSETIDKKVLKNHKTKYIQRQDNIWELISTEKQYCANLRIIQKHFVLGMLQECSFSPEEVSRIFPQIDELIDIHSTFLTVLTARQEEKADRSIDCIGDILIGQFGLAMGERMKRAYGVFCSRHKEGIDFYKHKLKTDRRFEAFIKKMSSKTYTKRRGVQDLVTVVTMRMTKYKTLLENIIKNSKESKEKNDKEQLSKALELNKEILDHIDTSIHERNQELRLLEIYSKIDARSTATYDKTKTFKKADLMDKNRKLKHEGVVCWRNARDKEVETLVIVVSDLIIFLQENDKKYVFFTQDNKPSVIPLTSLIVREKGSTKDNRGIYLIRQSKEHPEMYELVCKSPQERKDWVDLLRKAVNECPEEDEGVLNDAGSKEVKATLAKLLEQVELLEYRDKDLEKLCKERFAILAEIMSLWDSTNVVSQVKSSYDDDGELRRASDLIRLALDEASRLASSYNTVPQSNLARSWSSVGERQSPSYQQQPLPKRAETFNGFDQELKSPLSSVNHSVETAEERGVGSSVPHDSDPDIPESLPRMETNRGLPVSRRPSSSLLQQLLTTTSGSSSGNKQEDQDSGRDSLITLSSVSNITSIIPPSRDQVQGISQLCEYLHGILLVVNKQDSQMERLKQLLASAQAHEKFLEMELEKAEAAHEKKSLMSRSKQMEEIRNLHEQIRREREQWENEKEAERQKKWRDRDELDALRADVDKQQNDLKKEREELQRQKEALQKQIDYHQNTMAPTDHSKSPIVSPHDTPRSTPSGSSTDLPNAVQENSSPSISHRRSHSAELVDHSVMFIDPRFAASLTEPLNMSDMRAQQGSAPEQSPGSTVALREERSNSQGTAATRKTGISQISSKLVKKTAKNMLPLNLAESTVKKVKDKASSGQKKPNHDVIYF